MGLLLGRGLRVLVRCPILLSAHHLHPAKLSQWLLVDTALTVAFALLGAMLSFFSCSLVTVIQAVRGVTFSKREPAYALMVCVLLPVAYLTASAAVEAIIYSHSPGRSYLEVEGPAVIGTSLLFWSVGVFLYCRGVSRQLAMDAPLRSVAACVALVGIIVLPARVVAVPLPTRAADVALVEPPLSRKGHLSLSLDLTGPPGEFWIH